MACDEPRLMLVKSAPLALRFKISPTSQMKSKFLFAGLAIALTLGALAPTTARADHGSSGYYVTRLVGYDRCGHPVYQKCWVPVCNPRPVCPPSGYGYSSGYRPSYGGGGYGYRPGFSIQFGGSHSGYSHHHHCR